VGGSDTRRAPRSCPRSPPQKDVCPPPVSCFGSFVLQASMDMQALQHKRITKQEKIVEKKMSEKALW
jgi:hypothetical protein